MRQDRAKEAFDAAKQLAAEGKFQEALEKHIWFHDNALTIDESYYGVRLSYALAHWVELGERYSPAAKTLIEIRDKKASRLLAGKTERALFHDVESINAYLDQPAATVELFKKIEAKHPKFATSIYDLVEEALVATSEYSLARKYLSDPARRFLVAKRNFDEGMEHSETSRVAEASRRATEAIFTDEVVRIITVLDKTGDRAAARAMQAQALVVLENSVIRNAIID
jgi:hypothetical protein